MQTGAPWGLGRISHRTKGSTDYAFSPSTGTYVYVIDTGVRITHQLFQGRASHGFNAVGGSNDDLNGHGTHVAGIASSQTYGVARFANIISVKALDDSGSTSSMLRSNYVGHFQCRSPASLSYTRSALYTSDTANCL